MFTFAGIVAAGIIGAACVHELGHCAAGWVQGVPMAPTPFKEYLQQQIAWHRYAWIPLGGVAGTVVVAVGALVWYTRKHRLHGDAMRAGIFITP